MTAKNHLTFYPNILIFSNSLWKCHFNHFWSYTFLADIVKSIVAFYTDIPLSEHDAFTSDYAQLAVDIFNSAVNAKPSYDSKVYLPVRNLVAYAFTFEYMICREIVADGADPTQPSIIIIYLITWSASETPQGSFIKDVLLPVLPYRFKIINNWMNIRFRESNVCFTPQSRIHAQ